VFDYTCNTQTFWVKYICTWLRSHHAYSPALHSTAPKHCIWHVPWVSPCFESSYATPSRILECTVHGVERTSMTGRLRRRKRWSQTTSFVWSDWINLWDTCWMKVRLFTALLMCQFTVLLLGWYFQCKYDRVWILKWRCVVNESSYLKYAVRVSTHTAEQENLIKSK